MPELLLDRVKKWRLCTRVGQILWQGVDVEQPTNHQVGHLLPWRKWPRTLHISSPKKREEKNWQQQENMFSNWQKLLVCSGRSLIINWWLSGLTWTLNSILLTLKAIIELPLDDLKKIFKFVVFVVGWTSFDWLFYGRQIYKYIYFHRYVRSSIDDSDLVGQLVYDRWSDPTQKPKHSRKKTRLNTQCALLRFSLQVTEQKFKKSECHMVQFKSWSCRYEMQFWMVGTHWL